MPTATPPEHPDPRIGDRAEGSASGELAVRDATSADAAAVAEIYNQSIAAAGASLHEIPKTAADVRPEAGSAIARSIASTTASTTSTTAYATFTVISKRSETELGSHA
jgi:L-amino acid N-acyltransferase YncA